MNYNISISQKAYASKPDGQKGDYSRMIFEKQTFSSLPIFFDVLKKGHSFCYNMNDNDEPFGTYKKTNENFAYTNFVVIDVDKTDVVTPNMFYTQSTLPPSYLYTSFNHNPQEGLFKYHAIYAFKEKITSQAQFERVYDGISNSIHGDFPKLILDNSLRSVSQLTNGTSSSSPYFEEYYNHDNITTYSVTTFDKGLQDNATQIQMEPRRCPLSDKKNKNGSHLLSLTGQFEHDLRTMKIRNFLTKYSEIYAYKERSDASYNNDHYEVLDNTNAELWLPYKIVIYKGKKLPVRDRIAKGKRLRHKALISHGLAFRVIFPSISNEHLVFCLMYDLYRNFDNEDKKYTVDDICKIATCCLNFDMSQYSSKHKHKYRIDVDWCKSEGISPQAYAQYVRKMRTDEAIGELYDVNLSVRENTKILNEYGVKVSKSRVGKFKKEYKI